MDLLHEYIWNHSKAQHTHTYTYGEPTSPSSEGFWAYKLALHGA